MLNSLANKLNTLLTGSALQALLLVVVPCLLRAKKLCFILSHTSINSYVFKIVFYSFLTLVGVCR